MLQMSDMNVWGAVLVGVLVLAAAALFWLIDRRTFRQLGRVGLLAVGQLLFVGLYVWALQRADSVWLHVAWLVAMVAAAAGLTLRRPFTRKHVVALSASLLLGLAVLAGCVVLCVPGRLFVPVVGVLIGYLMVSARKTLTTYEGSKLHTAGHIRYLLANGATPVESLLPSIRRGLRAAVLPQSQQLDAPLAVAVPPLLCGLLMGGATVGAALSATILLTFAALAASVLTAVLLIVFIELQTSGNA